MVVVLLMLLLLRWLSCDMRRGRRDRYLGSWISIVAMVGSLCVCGNAGTRAPEQEGWQQPRKVLDKASHDGVAGALAQWMTTHPGGDEWQATYLVAE